MVVRKLGAATGTSIAPSDPDVFPLQLSDVEMHSDMPATNPDNRETNLVGVRSTAPQLAERRCVVYRLPRPKQRRMERETFCQAPSVSRSARSVLLSDDPTHLALNAGAGRDLSNG
jgi:hypothetical protein